MRKVTAEEIKKLTEAQAKAEKDNAPVWEQFTMEHCNKNAKGKWVVMEPGIPEFDDNLILRKVGKTYYIYKNDTERWTVTLQVRILLDIFE